MIQGRQRQNRKTIIVNPTQSGSQDTASQFTKLFLHALQRDNMLHTFSDGFYHGSLVTGLSLLQLWLDYRDDPVSGDLRLEHKAYNQFVIDPFFRKQDLSDCNGIWVRQYITKREAMNLLPEHQEEIMSLPGLRNGSFDGKFQYMPENYNTHKFSLVTYDEFYYKDYRTQTFVVDLKTKETMEWRKDKESLDMFLHLHPEMTTMEQEVSTVNLAILVQGKVFYRGPNLLGIDTYPFVGMFGYFEPDTPYYSNRIQGIVRGLRDAQYLYNRRRNIELDILESQVNSGWKYKESALVNPSDVFLYGQGRGIALKKDADMADIEKIVAPEVPASMIELSKLLAQEITEISGVSEELLGAATDDISGVQNMLRQGSALVTLQVLFDNADLALKLLGEKMLEAMQKNFTPGKVMQVTQEEPTQEFYTKNFGKYNAVVEEGMNTDTQKQMAYAQSLNMLQQGLPIPFKFIIENSNVQNKKELLEAMQQQQQKQDELQQLQTQLAQQEMAANVQLAQATAQSQLGSAAERYSRVEENKALAIEKIAAAEKDRDMALLDVVKTLKELDGMDIDHLHRLLDIADKVKMHEGLDKPLKQPETQQPVGQPAAQ
jgi:hypothetical protein